MRTSSLSNAALAIILACAAAACGRKGDPVPRARSTPQATQARWETLRRLEVTLPLRDSAGSPLVGLEQVRIYYAPMGAARPTPGEVLARDEVVLERRRPNLPAPGRVVLLDLSNLQRPAGWLVVVSVRVGNVIGQPSEALPWLDPGL